MHIVLNMIKSKALPEVIFFLVVFSLFMINASYVSYPDEFVNVMAGKFINAGKIPYREFFDHHVPFAWYIAALILKIHASSFVVFGLIWGALSFISLAAVGIWVRKHAKTHYRAFLLFLLMYPLLAVYFWLHLFLADSLAALLFSIIVWFLLVLSYSKKITVKIMLLTSLLTFFLIFSSLTYIYVGMMLYVWQIYLLGFRIKKLIYFCVFSLLPYLIYAGYLFLTKSLYDFYFANIVYNLDLYITIPNYAKGRFFNPLKFALTLIYNFWGDYLSKLTTVKDLNLYLPINMAAIVGSFTLLFLLFRAHIVLGVIFFFLLSFSAPRGSVKDFNETNYQIGVFLALGVISAIFSLWLLLKTNVKHILVEDLRRVIQFLLTIFLFFSLIFLAKNTYDKWYLRYTQKMPSVNDKAATAVFLDEILTKGDYYWVGPYEPHEIFFVRIGQLPGRYSVMLPQYSESEHLKKFFIADFDRNPPKIIIFKTDTGIFGNPTYKFGSFLLEWMKNKYTLLTDIQGIRILKSPSSFKLGTHLYLSNTWREELLESLERHKYLDLTKQETIR